MQPYYQDDLVTIYHGDCREWMPEADVIVTDPPYGIGWRMHGGGVGVTRTVKHNGIQQDDTTAARDWVMEQAPATPKAIFGSFRAPWPKVALRQVLVYQKAANAGLIGSVTGWRTDAEPIFLVGPWPTCAAHSSSVVRTSMSVVAHGTDHPHEKPVDVLARLIEATKGTVLDPFMGSGSTLVAAKSLGRRAIGIELEERYCEVAATRCSQEVLGLTG